MKERPILFSAPMVRAILDGRKTQTRRTVKPQPDLVPAPFRLGDALMAPGGRPMYCPYGWPGDRLWVRETWHAGFMLDTEPVSVVTELTQSSHPLGGIKHYAADGPAPIGAGKGRPSIHMPRWASRITLEVTGVRVERLQEISRDDCIAEGAAGGDGSIPDYHYSATPQEHYQHIWEAINGAGSWNANPWVWVVEFKRVQP